MTITATIEQDVDQGDGTRSVLVRLNDDVDGSVERISRTGISTEADLQALADQWALDRDGQKTTQELEINFEAVRAGQNAETLVWVRNTVDVGDEYICKGASNQTQATEVAAFAHIHREYSNQRIQAVTGLSSPQRQQWNGQAQSLEGALTSYQENHTADPIYFFEGFPEQ